MDSYQKVSCTSRLRALLGYQVPSKSVQPFWPDSRRTELFFFANLGNLKETVIWKLFQIGEVKFRFTCSEHVSPGDTSACQICSARLYQLVTHSWYLGRHKERESYVMLSSLCDPLWNWLCGRARAARQLFSMFPLSDLDEIFFDENSAKKLCRNRLRILKFANFPNEICKLKKGLFPKFLQFFRHKTNTVDRIRTNFGMRMCPRGIHVSCK